jgi:tripartite-type tricarboxylate transporter receptor subunit TctC
MGGNVVNTWSLVAAVTLAILATAMVLPLDYPTRPRVIIALDPGPLADLMARTLSGRMADALGRPGELAL